KDVIKANQEEILYWYFYVKKFKGIVKNFMANSNIKEKKAKGQDISNSLNDLFKTGVSALPKKILSKIQ
ncbi:9465_t:CDS:2, partial [Diversispora eburnea]